MALFDLPAAMRQYLLNTVQSLFDKDANSKVPDGFNIGINDAAVGQTVMPLHIHLIPRYAGDMDDPRGGDRWIFPNKAAYWK